MWSQIFCGGSIFWTVPSSWWPVTDAVAPVITEGNLLYASSTIQLSPLLLSQFEPSFPEGLLLMMVQSVVAAPDPNEGQAVKIGAFSGWLQEEVNSDIFPYANRRTLFVEAYANRYALSLACVPPGEADAAETAVFMEMCDQIWQQMMSGFSVKPIGIVAECPEVTVPPDQITWRRVSSNWYRYSFDIPAHWLEQRGTTSDRLGFLDDPAIYDQPNSCPLPNGLMGGDFSVDPPGNFGTGEPDSAPDTTEYAETTVAGHPAWIQTVQGGELMGPADVGITVYIKGDDYWYHFWLLCIPPRMQMLQSKTPSKLNATIP